MYLLWTMILLSVNHIAWSCDPHYCDQNKLLEKAQREKWSLPEQNMLGYRDTRNHFGAAFEPIDPISTSFIMSIRRSEAKFTGGKSRNSVNVLEIGPAYGLLAKEVLGCTGNNVTYTALDPSEEHLAIATQEISHAISHAMSRWVPVQGKFPHTRFKDQEFTHIGLFSVLHFLSGAECSDGLRELERILKPGGEVYINTLNYASPLNGRLLRSYYNVRYYWGCEYPGYIHDAKGWIEMLENYKIIRKGTLEKPQYANSLSENMLFVDTQELCNHIKRYTAFLDVKYAATITTPTYTKIPKTYTGLVLTKVTFPF